MMRLVCALFLVFSLVNIVQARTALDRYCGKEYRETNRCIEDLCQTRCYGGLDYPGCDLECYGRDCAAISVDQCPAPTCQVVKGCDGRSRCLPDEYAEDTSCGILGYVGDKLPCCEGMTKRCGIATFDGTCNDAPERSIYAAPMCLPCGNGTCDALENKCNCPEDCS